MQFLRNSVAAFKVFCWQIKNAEKNQQSTTRWGLAQLLTSISLFFFGIIIASISILFYGMEHCMIFAIIATIILILSFILACLAGYKALKLASIWLSKESEDPTATKQDLEKLKKDLIKELKNRNQP